MIEKSIKQYFEQISAFSEKYLYKEGYFAKDFAKMEECVLRPLKTISKKD